MPEVKLVVGREELEEIIQNAKGADLLVCIDFWAPWCGPCRMMSPIFDDFSDKYAESYVFVKVDVDKSEPVAQAYGVMAMPTFVIVRDGEKLDSLVGASKEKLEAMLTRHQSAT